MIRQVALVGLLALSGVLAAGMMILRRLSSQARMSDNWLRRHHTPRDHRDEL